MNPLLAPATIGMPPKKENPLLAMGKSWVRGSNQIVSGGAALGGLVAGSGTPLGGALLRSSQEIDDTANRFAPRATPNLFQGPDSLYSMRMNQQITSRDAWRAVPRAALDTVTELVPQAVAALQGIAAPKGPFAAAGPSYVIPASQIPRQVVEEAAAVKRSEILGGVQ